MKQFALNKSIARLFVMSVDVDGWSSLLRFYSIAHDPSEADLQVNVVNGIEKLLHLFAEHDVKATFFVTGEMAKKHPDAIRMIMDDEHEIACHGLYHERNEYLLTREEQKASIEKATNIIENITGRKTLGFRAPCLRANQATLEVLNEIGYLYDSSFLPMLLPGYYGSLSFRFKPYYPSTKYSEFLEIPISTNPIIPLPFSGSWMRNLGLTWVKFGVRMLFNMKSSVMIYIHPRDVLDLPFVPEVPWHLYRNTGNCCLKMLDELLTFIDKIGGRTTRAMDLREHVLATKE